MSIRKSNQPTKPFLAPTPQALSPYAITIVKPNITAAEITRVTEEHPEVATSTTYSPIATVPPLPSATARVTDSTTSNRKIANETRYIVSQTTSRTNA